MKLNVSTKIVYSELVIIGVIYTTFVPYALVIMNFSPFHLVHYINVTMLILTPLGIASAFYFMDRWECRPIEMLSFYLERRLEPPDDIVAAARVRTLNLPFVHAITVLIRYEIVTLLDCIYMGTIGDLPLKENIPLGIYAGVGLSIFPIFSFFLTERLLYPVRQVLAEKTKNVPIDDSKIIQINTRTRLLSIILTTVIAPAACPRRSGLQAARDGTGRATSAPARSCPVMSQLFNVISVVTIAALMLAAGIAILLATSISNPLGHMVKVIRRTGKRQPQGPHRPHRERRDRRAGGQLRHDGRRTGKEPERAGEPEPQPRVPRRRKDRDPDPRLRTASAVQPEPGRGEPGARRGEQETEGDRPGKVRLHLDRLPRAAHPPHLHQGLHRADPDEAQDAGRRNARSCCRSSTARSDRLARLINDILDLTKIEAGKLSWHITRVSLNDVVQTSVAGIQSLADNKSLTISRPVPESLPILLRGP